jgi:hypothetical protein
MPSSSVISNPILRTRGDGKRNLVRRPMKAKRLHQMNQRDLGQSNASENAPGAVYPKFRRNSLGSKLNRNGSPMTRFSYSG